MAKVTLKSIAQEVGVSPMVVSAVARNDFSRIRVSEDRRKKIQALIKKYNYVANAAAKSLQNQKTNIINLFVPSMRSFEVPFRQQLLISLQGALSEYGYQISFKSYLSEYGENDLGQDLLADAGLFFYFGTCNQPALDQIVKMPFPLLVFGHHSDDTLQTIYLDNELATYQQTKQLFAYGHRRIVMVNTFRGDVYNRDAQTGFERAISDHHEATGDVLVVPNDDHDAFYTQRLFDLGHRAAATLLELEQLPDAVMFSSDTIALAAMVHLQKAGIDIPAQLSVVANGNDDYARLFNPTLARMTCNPEAVGKLCAERIVHLMKDSDAGVSQQAVPMQLEVGDSIKKIE